MTIVREDKKEKLELVFREWIHHIPNLFKLYFRNGFNNLIEKGEITNEEDLYCWIKYEVLWVLLRYPLKSISRIEWEGFMGLVTIVRMLNNQKFYFSGNIEKALRGRELYFKNSICKATPPPIEKDNVFPYILELEEWLIKESAGKDWEEIYETVKKFQKEAEKIRYVMDTKRKEKFKDKKLGYYVEAVNPETKKKEWCDVMYLDKESFVTWFNQQAEPKVRNEVMLKMIMYALDW